MDYSDEPDLEPDEVDLDEPEDDKDEIICTTEDIKRAPVTVTSLELLPWKSRKIYISVYSSFIQWRESKNITSFCENVFLTYFQELSEKFSPSTLWSRYSMLRLTMELNQSVDIKKYTKLLTFLKTANNGYQKKKSNVFTSDQINEFLSSAPDKRYLAMKVALIFGLTGECRSDELTTLTVDNVEDHGRLLLVKLDKTNRSFTVRGDFYNLAKKYEALRPIDPSQTRYFLAYHAGRCTKQPIGKNTLGSFPKQIAQYLKLPLADRYTGHCYRRTAAALLANSKERTKFKDEVSD